MTPTSLPAFLRETTSRDHHEAERGQLQQDLVSGRIAEPVYRDWLRQMWLVHEAVEGALPAVAACGETEATLAAFLAGKSGLLRADLDALGDDAGRPEPLAATQAFQTLVSTLATDRPRALVGVLYVLEGSTNGNRFIARRLRASLDGGRGACNYLDPYADAQPAKWAVFKDALGRIPMGPDTAALADAARQTFTCVRQMGEELMTAASS